jgi:hypothetical protein
MEFLPVINIAAGETKPFDIGGNYIEVIDAVGSFDIALETPEGGQAQMRGAIAGAFVRLPYRAFQITSPTAQAIRLFVSEREGGVKRLSGSVSVNGTAAVAVQGTANVAVQGTANVAVQGTAQTSEKPLAVLHYGSALPIGATMNISTLVSASKLSMSNSNAAANVRFTLDGTTPSATHGMKLPQGITSIPYMLASGTTLSVYTDTVLPVGTFEYTLTY